MISIQVTNYILLISFWLAFSRIVAIMFQLPIFDNQSVPGTLKILTSLVVTYAFFPMVKDQLVLEVTTLGVENFWYLTVFHTLVGLFVGFLVKTIMNLFISSGSIMTQQIGFTSVSYFDPTYESRIGPFEKMIQWTILIMILTTGALIPMFKGMVGSFHSISPLAAQKFGAAPEYYLMMFRGIFESAFLLGTPILFTNLLLNLVMGIVARTIPQMNILMVSFVVNIGIGLLVFFSISEEYFHVAYNMYVKLLGDWFQFVL